MTKREIIWEKKLKIHELKQKLSESDYKAIKFGEGELTATEYAPILKQRREWRDEINFHENIIKELTNGN